MRDVTDNVTGELPGVEQKRGRGRPRKAHAMSNAERQAAFRARRKAQQSIEAKSVTKRMTVTEMLSDVDAYDECRLEVDELRSELADAQQTIDGLMDELNALRSPGYQAEIDELRKTVAHLQKSHAAELALNGKLRKELDLTIEERGKAYDLADFKEDQRQELVAEIAQLKAGQKFVTSSNGKSASCDQWLALVRVACKGKTHKQAMAVAQTAEFKAVLHAFDVDDAMFVAIQDAVLPLSSGA
ncbi:hypothetical protein [Ralstonia sp. ASV6]|uniref:hypothetical protein n=1 Tax=Ralstonia sp. ASV6 TaxID=2795124 RepID=UPI001E5B4719|nr:hypothetical protein [Ralstonia sp. ASV6]